MLNELIQSIILGIAQGLGEFLPISSTAHLVIIPYIFGWKDPGLAFDVALHFGTLIAVVTYFWKDWVNIFRLAYFDIFHKSQKNEENSQDTGYGPKLLWFLALATIPGILAGYFLENKAETILRHPMVVVVSLSIVGILLFLADRYSKKNLNIKEISWNKSSVIGLAQAVAIIPGVSRSGATMLAALSMGLNRKDSARFSFLLSTPIIFGASILKFPDLIKSGMDIYLFLGILFSALSGFLAIKYLLQLIEKIGYFPFFVYRIAVAIIIAVVYFSAIR